MKKNKLILHGIDQLTSRLGRMENKLVELSNKVDTVLDSDKNDSDSHPLLNNMADADEFSCESYIGRVYMTTANIFEVHIDETRNTITIKFTDRLSGSTQIWKSQEWFRQVALNFKPASDRLGEYLSPTAIRQLKYVLFDLSNDGWFEIDY